METCVNQEFPQIGHLAEGNGSASGKAEEELMEGKLQLKPHKRKRSEARHE